MPIYEYKCNECGEIFETFVLHREEVVICPKCGSKNSEKLISAPNAGASCECGNTGCGHSHSPGFS